MSTMSTGNFYMSLSTTPLINVTWTIPLVYTTNNTFIDFAPVVSVLNIVKKVLRSLNSLVFSVLPILNWKS